MDTTETPWYANKQDPDSGWGRVCAVMRDLETNNVLHGDEPMWGAFTHAVYEALDQEMYGEYLMEGGWDAISPMWFAFRSGWGAAGAHGNDGH